MLTATLLGAFGSGMVVVGPLKQASLSDNNFQTSSVIYEFVLYFCQNSDPASTGTSSIVPVTGFQNIDHTFYQLWAGTISLYHNSLFISQN